MELQSQSAVESSRLYHDLNSLSKLRGKLDNDVAIKEAAKQFESMFYSMMMKSMRDASKAISPDPLFESPSIDLFQDMYDKQLSLDMGTSEKGALGLADILVGQLTGKPVGQNTAVKDTHATNSINAQVEAFMRQIENNKFALPGIDKHTQDVRQHNGVAEQVNVDSKNSDSVVVPITKPTNNAEAVSEKGLDYSSPVAFVNSLLPYARKFAEKLNMDPKVLLAQAALETGWGKYVMRTADGLSSNNLFGIKAGRNWQGEQSKMNTLEFESGQLRQKVAAFKAYPDADKAFADYVELIQSKPRYDKALKVTGSPVEYLNQLQKAGYATDPDYADKIYQIYRSDTLNNAVDAAEQGMMRSAR